METNTAKVRARVAKLERQVLMKICQEIDSPRSLAVYLQMKYADFSSYLGLTINPDLYDSPERFADDYLVSEMLRKSVAQDTGIDKEAVAYRKWIEAEEQCRITNERIERVNYTGIMPDGLTGQIVRLAAQICQKTLGKLTPRSLQYIEEHMDFGPGATTSVSGAVTRGRKFSNPELTTTSALLGFGLFALPHLWRSQVKGFKVCDNNRLTFVPKNARTDRAITIENDLNIYVQKGIGALIRKKLANIGLDLDYQWETHHALVAQATSRGLSTIDLSSASDTLAFEVVKLFVPDDWFDLLTWARPEYTEYVGKTGAVDRHLLEKFSGMGNGFTFELETLIFWSILQAAKQLRGCDEVVTVFGDDMICSNDVHQHVLGVLEFLGFSVNREKTYGNGRFHESCGCDYFDKTAVRPFYLRFDEFDHEEEFYLYRYCNSIRRYACNRLGGLACDARFLPAWLACFCKIAKSRRYFVPSWDYSDSGIVGNFDEATPTLERHGKWLSKARLRGWGGYRFTVLTRRSVTTQRYSIGAYISAVHRSSDFTAGREAVRNRTRKAKPRNAYALHWHDLGPWI